MQSQCQWLRTTAIIFKLKVLLQLHCNEDNCTLTFMRFFMWMMLLKELPSLWLKVKVKIWLEIETWNLKSPNLHWIDDIPSRKRSSHSSDRTHPVAFRGLHSSQTMSREIFGVSKESSNFVSKLCFNFGAKLHLSSICYGNFSVSFPKNYFVVTVLN